MSKRIKESTRGSAPKRRPWSNDELKSLLEKLKTTDPLRRMVAIAAYTGLRIEEIAAMEKANVSKDSLRVVEGKTVNAVRFVPIHPTIAPVIERLRNQDGDEYLIPGLLRGGNDNARSHYVGKRFGYAIRKLGFTDTALTFHTLRNAFMHRCEHAKIAESTTKLLVGHARQSLTYGLYSPGVEFDHLSEEAAKVSYGNVDDLVKQKAADVDITKRSRRRGRTSIKSKAA